MQHLVKLVIYKNEHYFLYCDAQIWQPNAVILITEWLKSDDNLRNNVIVNALANESSTSISK